MSGSLRRGISSRAPITGTVGTINPRKTWWVKAGQNRFHDDNGMDATANRWWRAGLPPASGPRRRERGSVREERKTEYQWLGSFDKATAAVRDGDADLAITAPEDVISDRAHVTVCGPVNSSIAACPMPRAPGWR